MFTIDYSQKERCDTVRLMDRYNKLRYVIYIFHRINPRL